MRPLSLNETGTQSRLETDGEQMTLLGPGEATLTATFTDVEDDAGESDFSISPREGKASVQSLTDL